MFKRVQQLLQKRAEYLKSTDFGELDVLTGAEERSRVAHEGLVEEIDHLRGELHGPERRHGCRRKTDRER